MSHDTRVGLVTATYNHADHLAAAVDSALAQSHTSLEYEVLDDGSTDDTRAVLARYGDRVAWETHVNMGQAMTLNKGWQRSGGEILGYLSSDDLLEPEAAAQAVRVLAANPAAVAVYCDFELIDEHGARIRTKRALPYDEREMIENLVCFPGPGAFFRREVFLSTGGWDGVLRQVPDFDFWLRISRFGTFVHIPQVLAQYRIHDGSASFRPMPVERAEEIIGVVDKLWTQQGARLRAAGYSEARSRSMALLFAARNHFAARRTGTGLAYVWRAWRLAPGRMLEATSWRIVVGGLLRRPIYLLRALLQRRSS